MAPSSRLAALSFALLLMVMPPAAGQEPPEFPPDDQLSEPELSPSDPQAPAERPQEPPAAENDRSQQPTFRTGINFVRVDVIVTDRQGNPVTDLKAEDFQVFEDDRLQTIESFRLVQVDGHTTADGEPARPIRSDFDEEAEAAREDTRLFAIFLDDYHVRRGSAMGVRGPLIEFIQTQLGPADMIAVMHPLTPIDQVQLTRNHQAVIAAIEKFDGRKFDYTPRNQFEERYSMYPASTVERIRNQVSLSALESLVTHMGALREGRKSVIVVSEGYTNYLPPQLRDPIAAIPNLGNPARHDPMAGDSPMEDTARIFSDADLLSELRDLWDAANRNNTALYPLDPRGLASFQFDINENVGFQTDQDYLRSTADTLRTLADQTDGVAIVNRNDMARALRQVVRDASFYYLIGYNSSEAPADGEFHEIEVKVNRPGTELRARKGYWALTAEETARALAPPTPGPPPAVAAALTSIVQPPGRIIRTWIGTEPGEAGRTRVAFAWEPVPPVPGSRSTVPAKVSVMATGPGGEPYFRGDVPQDGSAEARGVQTVTFDADPGRLQLRLSVESASGEVLDSTAEEIQVPDFTAPEVRISTPKVLRAQNALEFRTIAGNAEAPPSTAREFRRTERLLIRFDAFAPGSAPTTTARLLNRAGQPMTDLPVQAAGEGFQVDLPLASLAAGEYLLEVEAKHPQGDAKELIAFRVVS